MEGFDTCNAANCTGERELALAGIDAEAERGSGRRASQRAAEVEKDAAWAGVCKVPKWLCENGRNVWSMNNKKVVDDEVRRTGGRQRRSG
jgi:hypothetical protein